MSSRAMMDGEILGRLRLDLAWFRAQAEELPLDRKQRALEAIRIIAVMFGLEDSKPLLLCDHVPQCSPLTACPNMPRLPNLLPHLEGEVTETLKKPKKLPKGLLRRFFYHEFWDD